jgi:hypothetical protein
LLQRLAKENWCQTGSPIAICAYNKFIFFFLGGRGADLAMSKQKLTLLPCNCEVRGLCMCKETQVIPVNRVAYKKRKIVKM